MPGSFYALKLVCQKTLIPEIVSAMLYAWSPIFSKHETMSMNIIPESTSHLSSLSRCI
jgi:NADH:ubiquinone oxidoreductase subunit H